MGTYGEKLHDKIEFAKNKIATELAVVEMFAKNFGGNERKIYTKDIPECEGLIGRVVSIRYVKTGIRVPASGGYDYYTDGYDYDPPYLSKSKTHKILSLNFYSMDGAYEKNPPTFMNGNWYDIEIEAENVEKIRLEE